VRAWLSSEQISLIFAGPGVPRGAKVHKVEFTDLSAASAPVGAGSTLASVGTAGADALVTLHVPLPATAPAPPLADTGDDADAGADAPAAAAAAAVSSAAVAGLARLLRQRETTFLQRLLAPSAAAAAATGPAAGGPASARGDGTGAGRTRGGTLGGTLGSELARTWQPGAPPLTAAAATAAAAAATGSAGVGAPASASIGAPPGRGAGTGGAGHGLGYAPQQLLRSTAVSGLGRDCDGPLRVVAARLKLIEYEWTRAAATIATQTAGDGDNAPQVDDAHVKGPQSATSHPEAASTRTGRNLAATQTGRSPAKHTL
jgi:hypothetical protein